MDVALSHFCRTLRAVLAKRSILRPSCATMGRERQEFPREFPIDQRIMSELPTSKIDKCFSKGEPSMSTEIDRRYEKAVKISFSESKQEWICEESYVRFVETPFQEGTFRKCYEMWEKGRWKDSRMVAKIFKHEETAQKYFDEAMLQLIANQYAKQFNALGGSRKISFVPVSIFKLLERGNQFITAEPYLEGKYVKHNDNDGHVDTEDPLPQAFSHFTWEASGRKLLVCDIQGVGDTYTDPSICSMAESDEECFGCSDRGPEAIRRFFISHRCNAHCRACGLHDHDEETEQPSRRRAQAQQPKRGKSLWTVGKAYGKSLIHALGMSGAKHKPASAVQTAYARTTSSPAAKALQHLSDSSKGPRPQSARGAEASRVRSEGSGSGRGRAGSALKWAEQASRSASSSAQC